MSKPERRKVEVVLEVKMVLYVDKGTDVNDVVNELDYHFKDQTGEATVHDYTIQDFRTVG